MFILINSLGVLVAIMSLTLGNLINVLGVMLVLLMYNIIFLRFTIAKYSREDKKKRG